MSPIGPSPSFISGCVEKGGGGGKKKGGRGRDEGRRKEEVIRSKEGGEERERRGVLNGEMDTCTTTLPDQCSEPEVARGKLQFSPSPSWQCQ